MAEVNLSLSIITKSSSPSILQTQHVLLTLLPSAAVCAQSLADLYCVVRLAGAQHLLSLHLKFRKYSSTSPMVFDLISALAIHHERLNWPHSILFAFLILPGQPKTEVS